MKTKENNTKIITIHLLKMLLFISIYRANNIYDIVITTNKLWQKGKTYVQNK